MQLQTPFAIGTQRPLGLASALSVLAEPLLCSLARDVERGSDDGPGVARLTGCADGVAQFLLGGREAATGPEDPAGGSGVPRRVGGWVELVQAGAVVVGLQVCHVVHLISGSRRTWAGAVGVDDAGGLTGGNCDQFQHPAMLVGTDHEQTVLARVFVLDEPDGVAPCVLDVSGVDPVLQGRAHNLHDVNRTLTLFIPSTNG